MWPFRVGSYASWCRERKKVGRRRLRGKIDVLVLDVRSGRNCHKVSLTYPDCKKIPEIKCIQNSVQVFIWFHCECAVSLSKFLVHTNMNENKDAMWCFIVCLMKSWEGLHYVFRIKLQIDLQNFFILIVRAILLKCPNKTLLQCAIFAVLQ